MNQYSKYLTLKSAVENLFGSDAWYDLKESNHLPTWRKYIVKTLKAARFSIAETVEIFDEEWPEEVNKYIDQGIKSVNDAKEIDEIIAVLAGTLVNISFLQIGTMPQRRGKKGKYPLRKGAWRLNSIRSVQYIQTKEQKENHFWKKQQNEIGFEKQLDLHNKYRGSKVDIPYSEWCTGKKNTSQKS